MKNVTTILLLLIIAASTFCQQTITPSLTKEDYMQKSKHQKTAAWILLGGGLLCTGIGSIRFQPNDPWGGENDQPTTGSTIFLVTGLAAIATSIPFFIASGKNKKRAAAVSFKNEPIPLIYKNSMAYGSIPSLNLKIKL